MISAMRFKGRTSSEPVVGSLCCLSKNDWENIFPTVCEGPIFACVRLRSASSSQYYTASIVLSDLKVFRLLLKVSKVGSTTDKIR